MGTDTAIGWTDHTFNPWWGCTRVSPGCQHCYAETFAKRTGNKVWGQQAPRRFFGEKHWREPLKWDRAAEAAGRPALVFCASMADVFEDRDDLVEPLGQLFELMVATPHLIWQVLTKRPELVRDRTPRAWWQETDDGRSMWPSNVWIGTTVEDQQRADERIPRLLEIPAPVRFLSCEPLLGPVDLLAEWVEFELMAFGGAGVECFPRVDWVICGGESGPGHRPLNLDHARTIRDNCAEYDVPFFFKQVGGHHPTTGGDLLDGQQHKAFPPEAHR
jgi:protein gp37